MSQIVKILMLSLVLHISAFSINSVDLAQNSDSFADSLKDSVRKMKYFLIGQVFRGCDVIGTLTEDQIPSEEVCYQSRLDWKNIRKCLHNIEMARSCFK